MVAAPTASVVIARGMPDALRLSTPAMPYRAGLAGLEKRLIALREQLAEIGDLEDRKNALERELEDVRRTIEAVHKGRVPPVLLAPRIPTPCEVPWESMAGGSDIRFCSRCSKHVYNLSALTRAEAIRLLESEAGACVRYYERPDGTLLTSDCPVGRTKRRIRRVLAGAAVGTALVGPAAVAVAIAAPGEAVYVQSVDELLAHRTTMENRPVRVEGTLVHGTLHEGSGGEETRLTLTSRGATLPVRYPATVIPDTLRDLPDISLDVMAEGQLLADGDFLATSLLAKAPSGSRYMMKADR